MRKTNTSTERDTDTDTGTDRAQAGGNTVWGSSPYFLLPVARYKMKLIRLAKCQARIDVAAFQCYVCLFLLLLPFDFG